MHSLRFPIGPFELPERVDASDVSDYIETISSFSSKISELTQDLNDFDLLKTYRPDGWNVRQLVHHCADSHMNAFIRFKLTLTEESPTIRPYEEAKWAALDDSINVPVQISLDIIRAVHARWHVLLLSMSTENLQRSYIHPEHGIYFRLDQALANYDWHCRHHLAHIRVAHNN